MKLETPPFLCVSISLRHSPIPSSLDFSSLPACPPGATSSPKESPNPRITCAEARPRQRPRGGVCDSCVVKATLQSLRSRDICHLLHETRGSRWPASPAGKEKGRWRTRRERRMEGRGPGRLAGWLLQRHGKGEGPLRIALRRRPNFFMGERHVRNDNY